jgi:hypothetical protein
MKPHLLKHVPDELRRQLAHDDDFDERGVLRDMGRYRVPMRAMDGKPTVLADGTLLASHRNGWRLPAKPRDWSCYDAYDKAIESQYTGFGSASASEFRGDQPGDVCTIDGWPGHLRKVNGKLTCVADDKTSQDARSLRDAAYRAYEHDLTSAWKGPITDHTPSNKPRRTAGVVLHDTTDSAYRDYDLEISQAYKR